MDDFNQEEQSYFFFINQTNGTFNRNFVSHGPNVTILFEMYFRCIAQPKSKLYKIGKPIIFFPSKRELIPTESLSV